MAPSTHHRSPQCFAPRHGQGRVRSLARGGSVKAGFTLVEVLVTIAVVGILTTLAYFQVDNYREQTRLRQAAEKIHQTLGWTRLNTEKKGDTTLVSLALPSISVYQDINGSGKKESTDPVILTDSVYSTVVAFTPSAAPPEASVAAPAAGLADGAGTCGVGVCCTQGSGTTPTWSDGIVNFCARVSPSLSPLAEDGAIYLASAKGSVKEVWAVVVNRAKSSEPTLWTATKPPTSASEWRKVR
ncbi:MAG: prepilin-type N-terminal cleavage/methylation domain-containing protein [Fibrobacterota bacterium]